MSMSTRTWLRELTSYYTPSSSDFEAARSHKYSIEARLDASLRIYSMYEIGSLSHGTAVWLYSDVDCLVSLQGERPQSPQTVLNNVKASLQERFPNTTIGIRRPAVVCYFSDSTVEVVPAYISPSGGYWISSPLGGWMKTHPSDHKSYVNEVNKKHDGGVKALVRQLKIWKYRRDVPISSCYLEVRAAKYMNGETSYLPTWDLHSALERMYEAGLASINDPTGLGSRFDACSSDAKKTEALSKLNTAVNRTWKAREHESDGEHGKAIEQLELLFNK